MSDDDQQHDEDQDQQHEHADDDEAQQQDDTEHDEDDDGDEDDGDTFPRAYVERVRSESRRYRERAQSAEARAGDLAGALWRERVAATDRLADPDDLAMPEDGDPLDPEAITEAIDDLLARKPHLAARRARGNLGQHEARDDDDEAVSLAAMLRSRA